MPTPEQRRAFLNLALSGTASVGEIAGAARSAGILFEMGRDGEAYIEGHYGVTIAEAAINYIAASAMERPPSTGNAPFGTPTPILKTRRW